MGWLFDLFRKQENNNITDNKNDKDNKIVVESIEELTNKNNKTDIQESKEVSTEQENEIVEVKKEYVLPSINLLNTYKKDINVENEAKDNIGIIENTLSSFKINTKVIEVNIGPRYTNYELELEEGTKYSSVSTLHKEIALALITDKVIINPSKKNKNTVSILVPNKKLNIVSLKEAIQQCEIQFDNDKLPIVLGEDIYGRIISADIREMPNLLISGSTGSGISTCISSIVMSLLMKYKPDELRFVIIDPKRIDFSDFTGLPHLLTPIVTDPKKSSIALKNISLEVERRSELLEHTQTKSVVDYNRFCDGHAEYTKLPFIVVVINELADLKITSSDDIEESISIIAQLARKVGVHLLIGTQRPSSNIITNSIKSNIPARIALSVPAALDSRIILDENGAEELSGSGEMLVKINKGEPSIRIQGCYISSDEISKVINYCISQQKAIYDETLTTDRRIITQDADLDYEYDDPIYNEVVDFAVSTGKISASLIQRKFRLGYNRCTRLIDLLEERGIIGPPNGSKPREVLVKLEKN